MRAWQLGLFTLPRETRYLTKSSSVVAPSETLRSPDRGQAEPRFRRCLEGHEMKTKNEEERWARDNNSLTFLFLSIVWIEQKNQEE
jgi:hypothetical protein